MNNNLYTGYIPNNHKYVDNYLIRNIGNRIKLHASFCDSIEWRDSIFEGILEDVGKDFIVINQNNNSYVIWSIYIDYLIFPRNTQ